MIGGGAARGVRRGAADRRGRPLRSAGRHRRSNSSGGRPGTEDQGGGLLVLLAELNVRHTRRHMPTRRVALDGAYLPTSGPAHGVALLAAVVATEPARARRRAARAAAAPAPRRAPTGSSIPRIALRHRLQHDVHGLDRSRHRMLGEDGRLVVELDVHGAQMPQVLGAVDGRGVAALAAGREVALDAIRRVVDGRWNGLAPDVEIRVVAEAMWNGIRPPLGDGGRVAAGRSARGDAVARGRARPALGDGGARPARGHGHRARRREPALPAAPARRASRQRRRSAERGGAHRRADRGPHDPDGLATMR